MEVITENFVKKTHWETLGNILWGFPRGFFWKEKSALHFAVLEYCQAVQLAS
jgi:hypothetical protein